MKLPIVILHGWAKEMTGKRYDEAKKIFEGNGYLVFAPDLPGFGTNSLKKEELFFDDYVTFVENYIKEILKKTKQKKIILLGHSFGGRIAIRFTSLHSETIDKLILTAASGIPRPLSSIKKKTVFVLTKILKPIFLLPPMSIFYKLFRKLIYYSIGEMDYYKSGLLSKTFKNVYQVSVVEDLEKISLPTLIVWGEKDLITPLIDANVIHNHIKNSKLVIVPNATHRLPYEMPEKFTKEVLNFIQQN